jgi:hypothetical protein
MFVQIFEGRVFNRGTAHRLIDDWVSALRLRAVGFLGATAGVSDDGRVIALLRFESAAAASGSGYLPERGPYWAELEKVLNGPVAVTDSDDAETFFSGGSNDARFVEIVKARGVNRAQLREMDASIQRVAGSWRPDFIGSFRVWTGPDSYVEADYFTSEAEMRESQQKEPPPEFAGRIGAFQEMMANAEMLDIRDPWLY